VYGAYRLVFGSTASAQSLALSFRELATAHRAGLPLDQALAMATETGSLPLREAWRGVATMLRNGTTLTDAMQSYRGAFHPVTSAIIAAGEQSGTLEHSFALLAGFFEAEVELRRSLQSALIYPTIVVIVAIAAVGVLSYVGFMQGTWAIRLLWVTVAALAIWLALRFRAVQQLARYAALWLPFFGGIMHELAVARFCYCFGTLIQAGVPYLEGLESTQQAVQHPSVERAVQHVYYGVRNGSSVEHCIRAQPAFPAVVRNLVGAGEAAGTLDDALLRAAGFLRQSAEYKIRNSAKLAGPLLTIIAGVIVLLILMTFMHSYFDLIFSVLED
jgi:type II secretory pathway component PulF